MEIQKNRSEKQQNTIDLYISIQYNTINLYNSRQEAVKMFNDYGRNISRNNYDSKQEGTGLKILTPKQMLQRLPIALAQIKAGSNSLIY